MDPITSKSFVFPRDNETCLCGSGKLWQDCCGSRSMNRQPPPGIFVIEQAINENTRQQIEGIARNNEKEWLTTLAVNPDTGEFESVRDEGRVTQKVNIDNCYELINQVVGGAWVNIIEKQIGHPFEWFEQPSILCYGTGGKYGAHSDAENYNQQTGLWERSIDRDWSMLIYITDNYEGGNIYFPNFNYHYRPKKADLVFFPADHRYVHEAQTVTAGERIAVVSWAALKDGPRSSSEAPPSAITIWR